MKKTTEQHLTKKKMQIALRRFYKKETKSKMVNSFIGTDQIGFKKHIDQSLIDGMNPGNFGKEWGLDHIVPVELFDLSNVKEMEVCYNHLNILPMFNYDNKIKGCSVHFSLDKLNNMLDTNSDLSEKDKDIINLLKDKCNKEINTRYNKYLKIWQKH